MAHAKNSRASDEELLTLLDWRSKGWSSREIARKFDLNAGYVRAATNRVRAADEKESGEPVGGYGW